jgi:WD40 repeat protein
MSAGLQPPGRALFADDAGKLRAYEGGAVREIALSDPVIGGYARLLEDGRATAIIGQAGAAFLWSEADSGAAQRRTRIPGTFSAQASFLWSPSARRLLYSPSFGSPEIFVIGEAGNVQRASLGEDLTHVGIWRSDDEVTLMTTKRQTSFPLLEATLWSWRPPADPIRMAGPIALSNPPQWSSDGRTLLTIEETSTGRVVRLRGLVDRTLLTENDLRAASAGCMAGGPVQLSLASWSPDDRSIALVARGDRDFVAFTDASGRKPSVFLAASGALGCYIPRIEWSRGLAVVPLLGPDCGFGAQGGLINAVAIVDPATGKVSELTLISRKGFLMSSGRWAAAIAPSPEAKATTFFSLQDPARSVTLPLWRLADYCCAP